MKPASVLVTKASRQGSKRKRGDENVGGKLDGLAIFIKEAWVFLTALFQLWKSLRELRMPKSKKMLN